MTATDVASRIAQFERWHYEFELDGHRTPVWDPGHRNRHRQRSRYVFESLVHACGGSLRGRRVLDLGCNAGWWSLAALEAGAEHVVGIDGRRMHVEQAELVFEVKGIDPDRYAFREADLLALDAVDDAPFDVVLCLGLLYHVNRPVELMRLIASTGTRAVCIDTEVSQLPGSAFEVRFDDPENPKDALAESLVLMPSRRAVHDLVGQFGYACATLAPRFDDWEACRDYRVGLRRAFLAWREDALVVSDLEREYDDGARGRTLGTAAHMLTDRDQTIMQEPDLRMQLIAIVAGAAGEKLEFGCVSTGVHDDLHEATALARSMVTSFGMSDELGPVTIGEKSGEVFLGASLQDLGSVGPKTLDLIDAAVERLVGDAERAAGVLLARNRAAVHETAHALLEHETLSGHALEAVLSTVQQLELDDLDRLAQPDEV